MTLKYGQMLFYKNRKFGVKKYTCRTISDIPVHPPNVIDIIHVKQYSEKQ